ncbi:hypothetical protein ACHAWF_005982 [Thalassiosira exigua]
MASFMDEDGTHFCGGSLIDESIVLTAAHCVDLGMDFTVVIGRHNVTNTDVGDDVTIAEVVPHPKYDIWKSSDYDIALVFLSRPPDGDIVAVSLNADDSVPAVGANVSYLGWGEIDTDGSTVNVSDTLREVQTQVMSNELCDASNGLVDGTNFRDSYEGQITSNMVCTFTMGKDSCQKDSGGPLILRGENAREDVQVGAASWGISCASKVFPGVAARISALHGWIEGTICNKTKEARKFDCNNNFSSEVDPLEAPIILDVELSEHPVTMREDPTHVASPTDSGTEAAHAATLNSTWIKAAHSAAPINLWTKASMLLLALVVTKSI